MSSKKKTAKSQKVVETADSKESGSDTTSVLDAVTKEKLSRRAMLKGTAAAAALAGVTLAATTGFTATNTGKAPPPAAIVAASPTDLRTINLNVNGENHVVNVYPRSMLVDVLHDTLGLISTKRPCNRNECGACTVLIDGKPYESCSYLAIRAAGHAIVTGEGAAVDREVTALQEAWVTADGGQCTFCGPGFISSAAALLKQNPNPTVDEIKAGLDGNLCRCGNYTHIINAVQLAASNLGGA